MTKKLICSLLSLLCTAWMLPALPAGAVSQNLGDVNSDGQVSAIDASDVLIYYSSVSTGGDDSFTDTQKSAADVNRDGLIDASDASTILGYYSHISTNEYETVTDYIIGVSDSSPTYDTYYKSKTYLVYDLDEEKLINYHDIHTSISPASFAKLLTAAVVVKNMSMDTVVKVGSELDLVPPISSLCLLEEDHELKVSDLLTGMLLASGNDAAYTLAAATARSVSGNSSMSDSEAVSYFCDMMNDFAAEIGMTESYFKNPDGSDESGQYTTAADMLKLSRYCLTVPKIREIVGTSTKKVTIESGEIFDWKNTNCLLDSSSDYYRSDAFGIKTGTTDDTGTCLIAAFKKDDKTYITLVSGCTSNTTRYDLTIRLMDNYT